MVKLCVQISAQLENLSELTPAEECEYYFKIKCTHCNEIAEKWISLNRNDTHPLSGSRGSANFVCKCKFCSREGSIDFEKTPMGVYSQEDCGEFKTIATLDCRRLEPVEFEPRMGWTATALNSNARWDDVDLSEKDWTEYDETAQMPVSITELETRIRKA